MIPFSDVNIQMAEENVKDLNISSGYFVMNKVNVNINMFCDTDVEPISGNTDDIGIFTTIVVPLGRWV